MNDFDYDRQKEPMATGSSPSTTGMGFDSTSTMGSGPSEAEAYNLRRYMEQVKEEQNLPMAVAAGAAAAGLGAVAWALFTYFSEYQIGWIAIGVGFLVGFAVRQFGKGLGQIYGVIGGLFALIGIVAGNILATALFITKFQEVPIFEVLTTILLSPSLVIELLSATFEPFDLLFYGLAIFQGYKMSFRRISQAEIDKATGMGGPISFEG